MKARTQVIVGAGGQLAHLAGQAPLTVRQLRTDEAGACALCLVGTAAGPLAGDDFELCLTLRDAASATLQAAGAHLAQGRDAQPGSLRTRVVIGRGARLHARPGAVVVGYGARVDVAVSIELAPDAAVDWRELVVLGRTGEPAGAATLRWDVTRNGRAVLRQLVDLADPELRAWGGMSAGHRVLATSFRSDPELSARTVVHAPTAVAARLDEHTVLATVLAGDAASALRQLDALSA